MDRIVVITDGTRILKVPDLLKMSIDVEELCNKTIHEKAKTYSDAMQIALILIEISKYTKDSFKSYVSFIAGIKDSHFSDDLAPQNRYDIKLPRKTLTIRGKRSSYTRSESQYEMIDKTPANKRKFAQRKLRLVP